MNKPLISIVCPAIRPDNWDAIYDSILQSTKRNFELIIVSPYPLTPKLQALKNVKYVKDFGSPVRASNIGALLAEGELITWTADDAMFIPEALDKNIDLLLSMSFNVNNGGSTISHQKNVVVAKYYEGKNGTEKPLQPDEYFKVNGSTWTRSQFIPDSYWLFNVAIMYRAFFEELGGWDADFEATALSHTDFAIRAQFENATVKMSDFPLLNCDHGQSDHSPVEVAQNTNDFPKLKERYSVMNWVHNLKHIGMNNWKKAPNVWGKRFQ